MNNLTISVFLASLLALPMAQAADEEDHAAHHPGADQSQAAPAQDDKAAGMEMKKMQEKMKKMHDPMSNIQSTSDPKKRQKLMDEHMQSKRESMKMLRGMSGGMMGKKKKGEPVTEDGEAMGGMQTVMMAHHKLMEDRMDMMQMMMEQMMEHETTEQKMERGG